MWHTPALPTDPGTPTPAAAGEERQRPGLGPSIVIKGDVIGAEDLTIDGQIEGRLELPGHTVRLGSHARVQAHIVGRVVTILGTVTGNVTASERVELYGSGSVDGNIKAPQISMADGAHVRGRMDSLTPTTESAAARPPMGIRGEVSHTLVVSDRRGRSARESALTAVGRSVEEA